MAEESLTKEEIFKAHGANARLKQQRENIQQGKERGLTGIDKIVEIPQKSDTAPQSQPEKKKPRRRGKKDTGFGKLYRSIFEVPEFCQLNWRDHHVYLYLLSCRNDSTGVASPGYENILAYLNRCKPNRTRPFDIQSVSRAVRTLQKLGLCRRVTKAHTGRAAGIWVAAEAKDIER